MPLGKDLDIKFKWTLVTESLYSVTNINFTYMYMHKSISVAHNLFFNKFSWDFDIVNFVNNSAESALKLSILSGKNQNPLLDPP